MARRQRQMCIRDRVSRGDLISETSVIDAVEETEDTPKIPDNNN